MLVYTSEVANVINEYQAVFGHRISVSEIDKKVTEEEFVAQPQQAIASKAPVDRYGGTYNPAQAKKIVKRKTTKPVSPRARSLGPKTSKESKQKKAVAEEKTTKSTKTAKKKIAESAKAVKATKTPAKPATKKAESKAKATVTSKKSEPKAIDTASKKDSAKAETKTSKKKTSVKAEIKTVAKKATATKKTTKKPRKLDMETLF